MHPSILRLFGRTVGAGLTRTAAWPLASTGEVTADQVVSTLEDTFGVTPGQRRNHIKGTCATGEFIGTAEGAGYSRSALLSGEPIPVVASFSLAGGNPKAPDTAKSPRGMALEFRLPDGGRQHMTMLNTPVFGAAHPESFLDMLVATKPDPAIGKPDPEKVKAFKASHPDNLAQAEFLASHNPPQTRSERAHQGPVRWDMALTIGAPGGPGGRPHPGLAGGSPGGDGRGPEYRLGCAPSGSRMREELSDRRRRGPSLLVPEGRSSTHRGPTGRPHERPLEEGQPTV
jgi:hypothetical protein